VLSLRGRNNIRNYMSLSGMAEKWILGSLGPWIRASVTLREMD
jgi:hypothetical protein